MPNYTWDHVHLRTPDVAGMAQWFKHIFNAEVTTTKQSNGMERTDIKLGGASIFLMEVKPGDGVNPPPVTPYQGLDHFGLAVSNIDEVVAEMKAKGVEFTKEPTVVRPGVKIAFLRGPQGISIELLDRDPKYT